MLKKIFAMRLTKQRHIAILYNYHTSLINTTLTSSQRSKQDQILPSQTCNISIFMSTFFFRKQGCKRAEHENDDIDAMLQEILDDDYQPISTHVSQLTRQNLATISEQSNTFLFFK